MFPAQEQLHTYRKEYHCTGLHYMYFSVLINSVLSKNVLYKKITSFELWLYQKLFSIVDFRNGKTSEDVYLPPGASFTSRDYQRMSSITHSGPLLRTYIIRGCRSPARDLLYEQRIAKSALFMGHGYITYTKDRSSS